jgi:hypothetical protein
MAETMEIEEVRTLANEILKYAKELERIAYDPHFYTSRFFPNWIERDATAVENAAAKLYELASENVETEY